MLHKNDFKTHFFVGKTELTYVIGTEEYRTKKLLISRCQDILNGTQEGHFISKDDELFLLALFEFHDEWEKKKSVSFLNFTVGKSEHGTLCFFLVHKDGRKIDISFHHAIKKIPSSRSKNLTPQGLLDFKNAARTAILPQIRTFRDSALLRNETCPVSKKKLTKENSVVDHEAPKTFDRILFDFCCKQEIDPLEVSVGSKEGTLAVFEDQIIESKWAEFHKSNASLRLLEKITHQKLSQIRIDWESLSK